MIELRAGYGRWLVRATFAARWFGNRIDPEKQKLVRAAVSRWDGWTWFVVGTAGEWYGQRIVLLDDL